MRPRSTRPFSARLLPGPSRRSNSEFVCRHHMHQHPEKPPLGPNKVARSFHRSGVTGWISGFTCPESYRVGGAGLALAATGRYTLFPR